MSNISQSHSKAAKVATKARDAARRAKRAGSVTK